CTRRQMQIEDRVFGSSGQRIIGDHGRETQIALMARSPDDSIEYPAMKTLRLRCWIVLAVFSLPLTALAQQTALDRYVHAPDASYKFELVKTIPGEGYTAYVLDLTSQTWKTPVASDHQIWKHWLTVVRPEHVEYSTGFLYITGGSNKDAVP